MQNMQYQQCLFGFLCLSIGLSISADQENRRGQEDPILVIDDFSKTKVGSGSYGAVYMQYAHWNHRFTFHDYTDIDATSYSMF